MERDDKWRYAFADLDQMVAWFPQEWLTAFHQLDFHLVIYDVSYHELTTRRSKNQVAYQPNHAKRVGEMELI